MERAEHPQRFCRKCLLSDIKEEEFLRNMRIYIQGLDEDIRTAEDVYQERLRACRQCDSLISGMCRFCGCFVFFLYYFYMNLCTFLGF